MIHRCETCPFWLRQDPNDYSAACKKATWTDDCQHGEKHLLITPHDDRLIYTDKSFGCVMHPLNKAIS